MPRLIDIDVSAEAVTLPEIPRKPWRMPRLVIDALAVSALYALFAAGALWFEPYPFDAFRDEWWTFFALAALVGVSYSWASALLGSSVRTLAGSPLTPVRAFVRALLAVPSAALGGFGFILAILDRRGQTLHDKLCGCVVDRPRG